MAWRNTAPPVTGGDFATVVIECVAPSLDGGAHAVKRVVGDAVEVGADIYKDGHDLIAARILYCGPADAGWRAEPLLYHFDQDRWTGRFTVDAVGEWRYTIEAWPDRFGTWRSELRKKFEAGLDVASELLEGRELVREAMHHARGADRTSLDEAAQVLGSSAEAQHQRVDLALDPRIHALMDHYLPRQGATRARREYRIRVDPPHAACAAWYEFFPRSTAPVPGRHGTFRDAARALPRIAAMGFDVVYLPPIHPIGRTHRKGPNNALEAGPDDPGSPWAIGNEQGGHTAVAPELGTLEDFRAFVAEAGRLGLQVALDYALQCSPDHPWVKEHPEWFFVRPDGTIKHAENPPKKYEDIYPLNFWCDDREGLWAACLDVFLFWIAQGVRTFRVDNPHTKPFAFWEWVIAEVQRRHPDVVFLSEAFTRPKKMKGLAKLGFTQSYTYFTWRNDARELQAYVEELAGPPVRDYLRGNFFANTPDILHEYLQHGGPPAFRIRLFLAATLLPLYGIYSGFELYENEPVREGSEEYLDSEKYQVRHRDWDRPDGLAPYITRINRLRREHEALRLYGNVRFVELDDPAALAWIRFAWGSDLLLVATTDWSGPRTVELPVPRELLGLDAEAPVIVEELLSGERSRWTGLRVTVTLDPATDPGRIYRIVRESGSEEEVR